MPIDNVYCPMYKRRIEIGMCFDAQMIVDDAITQDPDPAFFVTNDMRPICRQCPKREDLAAEADGQV